MDVYLKSQTTKKVVGPLVLMGRLSFTYALVLSPPNLQNPLKHSLSLLGVDLKLKSWLELIILLAKLAIFCLEEL